jgi:hypothetical protein
MFCFVTVLSRVKGQWSCLHTLDIDCCTVAEIRYYKQHAYTVWTKTSLSGFLGGQVMQRQLEAYRAQQAAHSRELSAMRAERDLALDQLTDLQDLVDGEDCLALRCT